MFTKLPRFLLAFCMLLTACNPDCDNLTGVFFADHPMLTGQEFLLEAANPAALENRDVFINDQLAVTRAVPDVGLIVQIPPGVEGQNVEMRIEDPDCEDFVRFDLDIRNESFFVNNSAYIPPAPPQVIIPVPPLSPPPNINNAWISPDNTNYCIWFVVKPVPGSTTLFTITPDPIPNPNGDDPPFLMSQELSVVDFVPDCPVTITGSLLYHENPVFGMIDTEANYIHFWIDRNENGVEEFTGQFIKLDETPYNDDRTPPNCGFSWGTEKKDMMMITSKQTGRRLILYQQR